MGEKTVKLAGGSLLYVSVGGWYGQKTQKTENEQFDKVFKMLPPSYFEEIKSIQGEAYRFAKPYSLPFPIRGVVFVPDGVLQKVEEGLEDIKSRYEAAVGDFCANKYAEAKAKARENLTKEGLAFVEADYPSPEALRDHFRMTYTVFSVDASEAALSTALGVGDLLQQFQRDAYTALVERFRETLSHMVNKLEDDAETGKRKVLHTSTLTKFQEFMGDFRAFAETLRHDAKYGASINEMERIAEMASRLMGGVSEKTLKGDASVRASVQQELSDLAVNLESHFREVGSRNLLVD